MENDKRICGYTWKNVAVFIASVEMTLSAILGTIAVIAAGMFIFDKNFHFYEGSYQKAIAITTVSILLFLCILIFGFGWILKYGARQRKYAKCRIWLIFSCILFILTETALVVAVIYISHLFFIWMAVHSQYSLLSMFFVQQLMDDLFRHPYHHNGAHLAWCQENPGIPEAENEMTYLQTMFTPNGGLVSSGWDESGW